MSEMKLDRNVHRACCEDGFNLAPSLALQAFDQIDAADAKLHIAMAALRYAAQDTHTTSVREIARIALRRLGEDA